MDARLQTRIQRYGWDAAAPYYHQCWEAQLRPAHDRLLEMLDLRRGESVLETACGSGLVTSRIAKAVGPGGEVLATDLSEAMIADLQQRLAEHTGAHIRTMRMAVEHLDVPEASFDCAVCALGLMYSPEPEAAMSGMTRAVRPSGRVAVTVWGERRNCGWAEVFPIVDRHVASDVCPMFFNTGVPGMLTGLFARVGLDAIREVRQSELLKFRSEDEVATAVLLGGPVALAVKRFDCDQWDEVRREFLRSVAEFRQPDGTYLVPGEFVTITGQRSPT